MSDKSAALFANGRPAVFPPVPGDNGQAAHELPPFRVNGARAGAVELKATNPKDAIGASKLPLDLVPDTLTLFAAVAFAEGASKYGAYNWRVAGVRSSIYVAALRRHVNKWWNGEECDPATGVPHLANAVACIAILLDAGVAGKLTDDRPPAVDLASSIAKVEPVIRALYAKHAHLTPHHHTQRDAVAVEEQRK